MARRSTVKDQNQHPHSRSPTRPDRDRYYRQHALRPRSGAGQAGPRLRCRPKVASPSSIARKPPGCVSRVRGRYNGIGMTSAPSAQSPLPPLEVRAASSRVAGGAGSSIRPGRLAAGSSLPGPRRASLPAQPLPPASFRARHPLQPRQPEPGRGVPAALRRAGLFGPRQVRGRHRRGTAPALPAQPSPPASFRARHPLQPLHRTLGRWESLAALAAAASSTSTSISPGGGAASPSSSYSGPRSGSALGPGPGSGSGRGASFRSSAP